MIIIIEALRSSSFIALKSLILNWSFIELTHEKDVWGDEADFKMKLTKLANYQEREINNNRKVKSLW